MVARTIAWEAEGVDCSGVRVALVQNLRNHRLGIEQEVQQHVANMDVIRSILEGDS